MARPTDANATQTRHRVLTAASQLFSDRGSDGSSMRDIARAAKVSQATVHHYFGSKAELREAVVEAMYAELATLQDELGEIARDAVVQADLDLRELITRIVQTSFRFCLQHLSAVRMTTRDAIDGHQAHGQRRGDFLLPFLDATSSWLGDATGKDPLALRLALRSCSLLIVRYALLPPDEMNELLGVTTESRREHDEITLAAVEKHLSEAAHALLLPS